MNILTDFFPNKYRTIIYWFNSTQSRIYKMMKSIRRLLFIFLLFCTEILKSDGFHTLLSYPNDFRFDLIVFDMTQGDCLLGFMHKFNYPPLMAVTAFSQPPYLSSYVGGHHYYAYTPHYNFLFGKNMDFYQRFSNFIAHTIELM